MPDLHAKMVIADDRIAILSSSNFLENSLSNNYETGILADKNEDDYECNYCANFIDDALSFVDMMEQKFSNIQVPQPNNKKCTSCGISIWNPNHELCFDCYKIKNQKSKPNFQIGICKTCKFSYRNGGNKCPIEINRMSEKCTYNEEISSWTENVLSHS